MAAKKKAAAKKRAPKKVAGTTREHRAVDARELRDEVKRKARKEMNGAG